MFMMYIKSMYKLYLNQKIYKATMNERKSQQSSIQHIKTKIKVVFLGDQSTGKTSILMRFMHDKFQQGLGATVGIDFMAKNLTIGSNVLRLQLWDTAGQERFRSLIPSYLKDATVTFIIFDITNERSFQNLPQWFDLCSHNRKQKSIMVLLGNKSDLAQHRTVDRQKAEEKASQYNIKYYEVSAKQNTNIKQAFTFVGQEFIKQHYTNEFSLTNIENLHNGYLQKLQNNKIFLQGNGDANVLKKDVNGKKKKKNKCC